jgi:hypothetical protein
MTALSAQALAVDSELVVGLFAFAAAAPTLVVVTAAVWVPRPGQALALLLGPAIVLASVTGVLAHWGWLGTIGVQWLGLLVAPVLPYRREWARVAVPLTALAPSVFLVLQSGFAIEALVYLGLPVATGLVGLALGIVHVRTARGRTDTAAAPTAP